MIEWINMIIKGFASAIMAILSILPDSPFTWDLGGLSGIWHYAAYFIPFQAMITVTSAYLISVAVWYVLRWALRFAKFIG